MNVILVHPTHGAKVAQHQQEIDNDIKNGWVLYTEEPLVETQPVENQLKQARARKTVQSPIEDAPSFLTSTESK